GKKPAITAAAAQMVDYTLTVAVSISAAIAALGSAFPIIAQYRVPAAVAAVLLVTLLNLRGSQESSRIFGVPTYAFITIMAVMIASGLFQLATGTLEPQTYARTLPAVDPILPAAMTFLVLRAFTAGSIALAGLESVTTSMASLKEPRQRNAQKVLFALGGIVLFLFVGTVILARALEVIPIIDPTTGLPVQGSPTVLAQMGQTVFGAASPLFFFLQIATALVLFVAANASYTDMPNLLATLARDSYAPHQFGERGAKLTLSNGIIFLFFAASGLIILFNASVHALIPLYAVGVFLSFTISQAGMCVHWIREREHHWKQKMTINAVGASMTGVALIIVFTAKFAYGAWVLVFIIPAMVYFMWRVHRHYANFAQSLTISKEKFLADYHPATTDGTIDCYIPISSITRATLKNINFANQLSHNIRLLHVSRDPDQEARLIKQYEDFELTMPLIILDSPYRDLTTPIVNFLDEEEAKLSKGRSIAVLTTRFTFNHYYDNILHNQTSYFISRALRDYKDIAIIMVPFHLNLQRLRDSFVRSERSTPKRSNISKAQKRQRRQKQLRKKEFKLQDQPEYIEPPCIDTAEISDIRYRRVGFETESEDKKN
ncbi:MAG: APC family permease, partial [Coriobacteriia bacterium]|nr:APC family permease [Coriobacteriia bacterium]